MKTAFQPLDVWRAFGCNSMGLVVDKGRQVLLGGQVAWDDQRHVVGVGDMRVQANRHSETSRLPLRLSAARWTTWCRSSPT